jgi:uncharacterized repeat protein (TIGR03803 family)
MKLSLRKAVLALVMVAGSSALTGDAAVEFKMLHGFTGRTSGNNVDGANPNGDLVLAGGKLYGTAVAGGNWGRGTVFSVNTDGQKFTTLHHFSALSGPFLSETNNDGAGPHGGLILRSNVLYGTANNGGAGAVGTVFKLNTDGSEFSTLHSFVYTLALPSGGSFPEANPLLIGDTLYGTAQGGGDCDNGTVYRINTDGSGYARVYDFCFDQNHHWTLSGLVMADGALYGCSAGGHGRHDNPGTVFKVRTDGSDFSHLHTFMDAPETRPAGRLVLSGGMLYGTALPATAADAGMVFKLKTDGTGFEVLYPFKGGSDGADPGGLVLVGNVLYGTTGRGGDSGKGTVFALNADGMGFQTLYSFTGGADGASPRGGLFWSDGKLYGATYSAGPFGSGTLFSLSLGDNPSQLTISPSGSKILLTWPTNASGLILRSSVNLGAEANWRTADLSTPLAVLDGQYVAILPNVITGRQQFYRLSR